MNKSEFIRSLPLDMPAAEVIARAAKEKMKIEPGLIYGVRSALRAHTEQTPAATAVERTPEVQRVDPSNDMERAEALLMALAAEIGLGKSMDLLSKQREKVLGMVRYRTPVRHTA